MQSTTPFSSEMFLHSELNPVEGYFNILKLKYKSLWLKSVVTNTKPDVEDLARTAAYSVDPKTIQ